MNNPSEYRSLVLALESKRFTALTFKTRQLLHAAIGLSTEAGELLDAIKKHLFYGDAIDDTNIREELGDIRFYYELACDAVGAADEEIIATNSFKLGTRYKGCVFTQKEALHRDLVAEREQLENKHADKSADKPK